MRRGILGGTFDPPHLAHLVAGEAAYRQLGLDSVSFIPAGAPWQKSGRGDLTPPEVRWEMTRLAVAGVDYFEADDREVVREGWTYTVDTLAGFPDDEVVLILGADAASRLPTWHRADEVIGRARIAVMPRLGTPPALVTGIGAEVDWLDVPEIPVSGTMLRARRQAGHSIRFFVREQVWEFVEKTGLYAP